jgi:putative ATP-dependent endonuclease of the OLD family
MILKKIQIKNFRNFKDVEIELDNKNVIFGMNDVGKTNFLYAIRYLLDKDVRRLGFSQSDFYKNNVNEKIEIILEIDISDYDNSIDTKKLVAEIKGARTSKNLNQFFIKLEADFDEKELFGEPILKWGNDLNNLIDIPSFGSYYAIDNVFKIIYINPLLELDQLFNKNKRLFFNESENTDEDKKIIREIKELTDNVNKKIGQMTVIQNFQESITKEYQFLKSEDITIEMKSEMAIKGFFSDIIPYIKRNGDDNNYPTSGDGRRKILSYSLLNYLNKRKNLDKIVIYLIEEPENSLHRSMQIALSKKLFENDIYNYFFLSTHSAEMMYEMDNTMLIRIYSKDKILCSSYMYNIGKNFKSIKRKLNRSLSNALFAEKVLLVEGPSEKILFEKVLSDTNPEYELKGGYILEVGGTNFIHYTKVLNAVGIITIIKTDNDLRVKKGSKDEYEVFGINRCLKLLSRDNLENIKVVFPAGSNKNDVLTHTKKEIYKKEQKLVEEFKEYKIFLSEVDLENDLNSVLGDRLQEILGTKSPINYLQSSKLFNMVELVEGLTKEDSMKIYESDKFACLRELN